MLEAPIDDYLHRIGIDSTPPPTSASLRTLQRAHLLRVPYDNLLEYIAPDEIPDPRTVVERIVHRRLGGTGTQLNVGFAVLLHSLGYLVSLVRVQARTSTRDDGPTHLAAAVRTPDGRLLADVSGALSDEPLRIEGTACQDDTAGRFAVTPSRSGTDTDVRVGSRRFTIISPRLESAVPPGGWLKGTSERQVGPVVSLRQERGRITLAGVTLTESIGESLTTRRLPPSAIPGVLQSRFGMYLDRGEAERLVARYR